MYVGGVFLYLPEMFLCVRVCRRVLGILRRLEAAIASHPELGPLQKALDIKFTLEVVENNDPEMFVLPGGNIFVFTGYLDEIHSDDAFACMLAHEIAHALLQHRAEETSMRGAVGALAAVSYMLGFAAIGSVGKAGVLSVVGDQAATLIPPAFRRDLETEADLVGMMIAARACYDPRAAPAEWQRIATEVPETRTGLSKLTMLTDTHPSHEARVVSLQAHVGAAMDEARGCKCAFALVPSLPPAAPAPPLQ